MFKIIADSSHDMDKKLKKELKVELIPFILLLDGKEYIDDAKMNVVKFMKKMKESKKAGSACPSPNDFLKKFKEAGDIFVITISSKLSGTYNSAILAKKMYEEEHKGVKKIHIFDSKTASGGETLVSVKIRELEKLKYSFDEIVSSVEDYISEMKTYFISESLDNLIKNGRIPKLKGTMAIFLNIKPIMCAIGGEIELVEKVRGTNKAYMRLIDIILENGKDFSDRVLTISNADNEERAKSLQNEFVKRGKFKDVVIIPTGGLSSLYVDNKGIIIAY